MAPPLPVLLAAVPGLVQDTTVVVMAHDGIAVLTAWSLVALVVAVLAVLVVALRLQAEMRRHRAAWESFLATASDRSASLVEHAGSAVRNIDRITQTVRTEAERLGTSVGGVAGTLEEAATELRRRARDLLALLDLAQSEAEAAVLEAASRVRAVRESAAGLFLARHARGGGREEARGGGEGDGEEGVGKGEES